MSKKLTLVQTRVLDSLDEFPVYVFCSTRGKYSFGNHKDNTYSRVYTTATAKSLIKKGYCEVYASESGRCFG